MSAAREPEYTSLQRLHARIVRALVSVVLVGVRGVEVTGKLSLRVRCASLIIRKGDSLRPKSRKRRAGEALFIMRNAKGQIYFQEHMVLSERSLSVLVKDNLRVRENEYVQAN